MTRPALIFDIDDTLYDQVQPFYRAFEKCFPQWNDFDREAFFRLREKYGGISFDAVQRGEMTTEEMHIYRMVHPMADFGMPITDAQALEFQREYKSFQNNIYLSEEMIKLLDWLKSRQKYAPIGIISNGPSAHQWGKVHTLGLLKWFEERAVVISGDLNTVKPDPAIFRYTEEKLKLDPDNTWFVGDNFTNDILGAAAVGWKTIWFNRRRRPEKAELHGLAGHPGYDPDHTVYTEAELADLLKQEKL